MLFINQKNYSSYIVGLPIIFILITAIVTGGVNVYNLHTYYTKEVKLIKKEFIKEQKEILKKNVNIVNLRVKIFQKNMYINMKSRLKDKSNVGFTIANTIYSKYKNTKTEQEIKEMIFTAINKISWRNGTNYFWVVDYDGIEHITTPQNKEYIGKNILHIKDNKSNFTIKDEIALIKKQKEGYLYNSFCKPNDKTKQYEQISYVKDLGFYDWYIGTAEFLDDGLNDAKQMLINRVSEISFINSNYIFILDLLDLSGGDKFAKMLVNSNRPDLIEKYLSDSYKDIKGKEFRKDILKQIRQNGEAWVEYHYKKPNGTIGKKLSYFYHNKDFNWIVANGFYFDDVDKIILKRTIIKNNNIRKRVLSIIVIALLLTFILSIFSIILSKRIKNMIDNYDNRLKDTNKNLTQMVNKEINKNSKKDLMIFRQSKSALMGEMIGNIAHQWRQPLNSIGVTMMKLEMINDTQFKSNKQVQTIVDDTNTSLDYMSKTIDDFRNFFSLTQNKEKFYAHEVINEAVSIIKVQLDNLNINLIIDDQDGNIEILGHKSELIQVILNIINNAKDAIVIKLKTNDSYEPQILITITDTNDDVIISISDNAGGIPKNILDKVFEPYFTTKFKSKGTGIGLYMSKMIIEKDMQGSLDVMNNTQGAIFTIVLRGGGEKLDEY